MDLFTQNMINRTKQRQELLSKLSKPISSGATNLSENVKQKTELMNSGKSLKSDTNIHPTTSNDIKSEKENNYFCKVDKIAELSKPAIPKLAKMKTDSEPCHELENPNSQLGSRRTRLDALAYKINDWEDESLINLKQAQIPESAKKPKASSVGPSKKLASPMKNYTPTASSAAVHVKAAVSPTKTVALDKSVLHCLESQGFKSTASRSRLIYEYEKEQEGELEDETAKSWIYSAGTPEKLASTRRSDNRSPGGMVETQKNKQIRSPLFISKNDKFNQSPQLVAGKQSTNQKMGSKESKSEMGATSPVKRSVNSGLNPANLETIHSPSVPVSVLKRVAQFDSPRPPARDPAEFSLSERKALFEKNKGKPPTPKTVTPELSRSGLGSSVNLTSPSTKRALAISPACTVGQRFGLPKSAMENSLSAHKNASNAKAERMKELDQLCNRHGGNKHLEPTIIDPRESTSTITKENSGDKASGLAFSRDMANDSPVKSPVTKLDNYKGFRKSPAKDSYAGLEVKPIRVSPPKPGKLYPCLSDIEMTTENETDSDDGEEIANDSSVANGNTSLDLDSSFTTDILGRAGLSQFINTPKKKLQEMQLNKQALLRSIAEQNFTVSDDDCEETGEISHFLNEALEHSSEESTPPKQLKLERRTQEEDDPMTLFHSVSAYRKKQQDQTATPVKQVVRNPEVRQTHVLASSKSDSHDIPIQQQIRNLQEEINSQQTVMAQASQALTLCRATAEFSGSTEQVEGEKLLLIASQKRQAAMNEIQRLKTEAALKKQSSGYASRGTLSISGLCLPLKKDFVAMQCKGGDDHIHYFIMLIRNRGQVIPLQMLSTLDGIQEGALRFPNLIQLRDLPSDFQISIEVYALQTKKEKMDHNQKYHIRKESSKMRLTPKKLINKQDSRLQSKTTLSSPGLGAVRNSSFGLVGFTTITSASLRRRDWSLEKVPLASPIDGTLQLKIQCHTESLIEERGFLTVFEDVGGFGAWHRRWCLLSNDQLLFWKYPDDEKRKEPLSHINLRKCVTDLVDAVSHDICARPNTFLLVTVREPQTGDKDSLVMTCYSRRTALRHLISADLKDERQLWCSQINRALANLRAWDTDSVEPSAEGLSSNPMIIG